MKLRILAIIFLSALQSYAANYNGEIMSFKQPDGSMVDVKLFGSEYYMRAEGLDAYTLIRDEETGWICYATLSNDQDKLVSTKIVYHGVNGNPGTLRNDLQLQQHLQIKMDARRSVIQQTQQQLGTDPNSNLNNHSISNPKKNGPNTVCTTPINHVAGTIMGLCIVIDFSDYPGSLPMSEFNDFCNDLNYSNYGNNGSLRSFYHDISGGLLDYQNVVFGYFRAPQPFSYYDNLPMGTGVTQILGLALNWIQSTGFDFSTLSVNPDQSIMAINIMYTGNPPTWGQGMWFHKGYYSGFSANGVHTSVYNCSPANAPLYISTICHENGHMICKWPDTYKYDMSEDGIGAFDLMCASGAPTNPVLPNPLFIDNAGWGQMIDVTNYTGMNYDTANSFISYRYSHPTDTNEFFLFQHRQETGRSTSAPDAGLTVWHIDRDGDNQTSHHEVYLMHANNNFGDEYNAAYKNPYVPEFSANSVPSSEWYSGAASGLYIWGIDTPNVDVLPYHLGPVSGLASPVLSIQYVDATGDSNGNGFPEAGESVDLNTYIENNGIINSSATILSAIATGPNAGYVSVNGSSNMGAITVMLPYTGTINVTIDPSTPLGTVIDFVFTLADPLDTTTCTASIIVGRQVPMSNGPTSVCSAIFYDQGKTNNYANNTNYTKTLLPSTTGNYVTADFVSFDVENDSACSKDYLEIYNGPTNSSPLIGIYCGTNSPGHVQSSDPSGALTFVFHSNNSVNAAGWEAYLSCSTTPGVPEYERPDIKLFPNPVDDIVSISGNNIKVTNLTDALGQKVQTKISDSGTYFTVDLSTVPSGIYFVNYEYQKKQFYEMLIKK
jgi:M6 family metalloprotease-like protein